VKGLGEGSIGGRGGLQSSHDGWRQSTVGRRVAGASTPPALLVSWAVGQSGRQAGNAGPGQCRVHYSFLLRTTIPLTLFTSAPVLWVCAKDLYLSQYPG
jgi:hypothetical protein